MQKITRMYVGNYGVDAAWFDGIIFDLTNPDTGLPTNTIINLENGGGKTTLLSFIFSCFEPATERFLKHVQDKKHQFSEYFSRDGLPGVALIEWEMPAKVAGGQPYRMVMGQAVSVRSTADRDAVDRVFFSFEANSTLKFESVPAPKLTTDTANSFTEFSRWLHEAQKTNADVFHTRVQHDWQRHLQDARMIDIDMMKLQVNFSAQEGGIGKGFLTFDTEAGFIRTFFELTLDPVRARDVRDTVVAACDKLRSKPAFQRRLCELATLQGGLAELAATAETYNATQTEQQHLMGQAAGLVLSLNACRAEKTEESTAARDLMGDHALDLQEQNTLARNLGAEAVVLTELQHIRAVTIAETLKQETTETLCAARDTLVHIRAAKSQGEILAATAQLKVLEEKSEAESLSIEAWKTDVDNQGAVLRHALTSEETKLRERIAATQLEAKTAADARTTLEQEHTALTRTATTATNVLARLDADTEACAAAHLVLRQAGSMTDLESSSEASQRWLDMSTTAALREDQFKLAAVASQKAEAEHGAKAQAESVVEAKLGLQVAQIQHFIADGAAARADLAQLPVLCQAAEAEYADPDSLALPPAIDVLYHSSELEISQIDVRCAELRMSKASIEDTGVAGRSADVDVVVTCLLDLGIKSARPFSTYIAKALPSVEQARDLVASNPVRFLGVCVASAEFDKAKALQPRLPKLTTPVMVSTAALDAEVMADSRFVVSATGDAVFNFEAAAALLPEVDALLTEAATRRAVHSGRCRDCITAKQQLAAYRSRFSPSDMQKAAGEVEQLIALRSAAQDRAAGQAQHAIECREMAQQHSQAEQQWAQAGRDAKRHSQDITRFQTQHEHGLAPRASRRQELEADLLRISNRIETLKSEQRKFEEAGQHAFKTEVELKTQADTLGREWGALKYYSRTFAAKNHLAENPSTLASLRDSYRKAVQAYEAQESDRIGILHHQRDTAREACTAKRQAYTEEFPGVRMTAIAPYLSGDFAVLIPATQAEVGAAEVAAQDAASQFAVDSNNLATLRKTMQPAYVPTEEMQALSDTELTDRIAQTSAQKEAADAAARYARQEMSRAEDAVTRASAEAKSAQFAANTLTGYLSLPDGFDVTPIALEPDFQEQVTALTQELLIRKVALDAAQKKALRAFNVVNRMALAKSLMDVEPDIAAQLQQNDFEAACADSGRMLAGVLDRIAVTESSLEGLTADFDACLGEVVNLANTAINLLNSAVNDKQVPAGAPYVGGKAILKMRARFKDISQEARKQALQQHLDLLIDTSQVPATGASLIAEALLRIHGRPLGLQLLKMIPDEALQYVAVDNLKNSGGEGVVMAMFLYLLINQLRSETQVKLKKNAGGPLILDNPFANLTHASMWDAQIKLAAAMDVQLIFATAMPDTNVLGEFSRFIRLRKPGQNSVSGRWSIEPADIQMNQPTLAAV